MEELDQNWSKSERKLMVGRWRLWVDEGEEEWILHYYRTQVCLHCEAVFLCD